MSGEFPQRPSVGRVVHYVARGSKDGRFPPACRAAIVTEVGESGVIGLCAINPAGLFFHSLDAGGCEEANHRQGAGEPGTFVIGTPGTWHWPERV